MERFSNKELVVIGYLNLLLSGFTLEEIADMVHLSIRTIEANIYSLCKRFNVVKRDHLIGKLIKIGVISSGTILFKEQNSSEDEIDKAKCIPCKEGGIIRTFSSKIIFY